MCIKLTDTPDRVSRLQRWNSIRDHYDTDPSGQDFPFRVERWVYVSRAAKSGDYDFMTFSAFEDLCEYAGRAVLEDGRVPVAAYDVDTSEHVELHVTTPIVSRAEEQGQTVSALRGEQ